jgi:hypothetical protein
MTVKDCTSVKEFWQLKKEIRCNSDTKWASVAECGPRFVCKAHIGLKGA